MLGLTKRVTIRATFTANDWQLFTNSMDCSAAAAALNAHLEFAIDEGFTREATRRHMVAVMQALSEYGAADSEPVWFLEQVLNEIYGENQ